MRTESLRISAKDLGSLAMPDCCERCFWIHRHYKLPFQIFPGIFSSIDSYTKKVVHGYFEKYKKAPDWMAPLGKIKNYVEPPLRKEFQVFDEGSGVILTGVPDEILQCSDDSYLIIDYKTAKYTERQDEMLPVYDIQLNGYAYIAERCGLKPVVGLALVYTEPRTDEHDAMDEGNRTADGFKMPFGIKVVGVELNPDKVIPLMKKAGEIYDHDRPPKGRVDCKDCERLERLIKILN